MLKESDRICVIDTRCGAGKTSYMIQYINELSDDVNIIFITPFLKECERIQRECKDKGFYTPDVRKGRGSKMTNFIDLVSKGRNIVSTHALFSSINDDGIELIKNNNYILILDEVMDVVNKINLYDDNKYSAERQDLLMKSDVKSLLDTNIIKVNDDYSVSWVSDQVELGKYETLKVLADRKLLYLIGNDLIVWTFPIEVFQEGIFNKIFILTYMFDYQIQAYYYKYFNLDYAKYIVKDLGNRVYDVFSSDEYPTIDKDWKDDIKKLIDICDIDKLNRVGSYFYNSNNRLVRESLSKSWFTNTHEENINLLNRNIANYLKNVVKSKSNQRMWTCFKDFKTNFKNNKELSNKHWIELSARATNDFANRDILVYPINRYLNPFLIRFFEKKDISINQDGFAVSELIQWVFRSAIRDGKPISIYIPSQRMRELFISWLNDDSL